MSKILLLSATDKEHEVKEIHGVPIHITGIGKVNAAVHACRLIQKYDPEIVINFGSCGNLKEYEVGKVLRVGTVVNSIDTLGFYNQQEIVLSDSPIRCLTTDQMYDSSHTNYAQPYLDKLQSSDICEMELFSIAKACQLYNKKLHAYKWVSDDGSDKDWLENAKAGFNEFKALFKYKYLTSYQV